MGEILKCALSRQKLPTNREVIGAFLQIYDERARGKHHNQKLISFIKVIIPDVQNLWIKVDENFPLVSATTIRTKMEKLITCYQCKKKSTKSYESFVKSLENLFNISKCSCFFKEESICSCPIENKIPDHVLGFYLDQLGARNMVIDETQKNGSNRKGNVTNSEIDFEAGSNEER